MNSDVFTKFICLNFNYYIDTGEFLQGFKNPVVIPAHRKKEKSDKTNYKPVSILPNLYKIDEKLIYTKLYDNFDRTLLPSQCGSRKGYSSKKSVDNGNKFEALLTNL